MRRIMIACSSVRRAEEYEFEHADEWQRGVELRGGVTTWSLVDAYFTEAHVRR